VIEIIDMQNKLLLSITVITSLIYAVTFARPVVTDGDRVAIIGDSITEQKIYSCYIEAYLLACSGLDNVQTFNFGCGGEHAIRFIKRMETDVWSWEPTVITIFYGMNDGYYRNYEEQLVGTPYRSSMEKIVDFFKSNDVKVIVGTPGVVDVDTYPTRNNTDAQGYNDTLAKLAEIARQIAVNQEVGFTDIHGTMMSAMLKAKAEVGKDYYVAGKDGIHPGPNGQLIISYSFLKSMGFDGQIAKIDMDITGATTVSSGHKIISLKPAMVEIESLRYPFCFTGNSKDPDGNVSILPFVPFQQDLNRFELVVRNLPGEKAEVVWGSEKKVFSKAELENGINLAAEFLNNPFSVPFALLLRDISSKQMFENWMIRNFYSNFRTHMTDIDSDAESMKALNHLRAKMDKRQIELNSKIVNSIKPVRHTITVSVVNQ
jgi:hypothetical protein